MKKNKKTEIIADPDKLNQLSELGDSLINSVRNLGIDIDLIGDDERLLLQELQEKKTKLAKEALAFKSKPDKIEIVRSNGNIDCIPWDEYKLQEPDRAKNIIYNNKIELDLIKEDIKTINDAIFSLLHTTEVTIDTINKKFISTKGTILSSLTGSIKNLSESNKANIEANKIVNTDYKTFLKEIKQHAGIEAFNYASAEIKKVADKTIETLIEEDGLQDSLVDCEMYQNEE